MFDIRFWRVLDALNATGIGFLALLAIACVAASSGAQATDVLQLGGGRGVLERPAHPRGGLVLMPGGDGAIGIGADGSMAVEGNTLVRERRAFAAAGFATLVIEGSADAGAAVAALRRFTGPVTVVAMSRAGTRVGPALAGRPDGLVLVSAMLDAVRWQTSAADLPPTLVIHHREDTCRVTLPATVEPFLAWAGARARAVWLEGGRVDGPACEAHSHHGFAGIEGRLVSAIAGFAAHPR